MPWDPAGKYALLHIHSLPPDWTEIEFPLLERLDGGLKVSDNVNLTAIKFPKLEYIASTIHIDNNIELGRNNGDAWATFSPNGLSINDSFILDVRMRCF